MKRKKWPLFLFGFLLLGVGGGVLALYVLEPEYAYMPSAEKVLQDEEAQKGKTKTTGTQEQTYDLWGQTIVGKTLSPRDGAVPLDEKTIRLGREMFYKETFGNEVFLTDIMGIVDGALTIPNLVKAIVSLRGQPQIQI